jgi:hypothetical protein
VSQFATHLACYACYAEREPDRDPVRLGDQPEAVCCFCGQMTEDGVWYRADSKDCVCPANHEGD